MVQRSKGDSLSRFVGSDVSFAKAKAEALSESSLGAVSAKRLSAAPSWKTTKIHTGGSKLASRLKASVDAGDVIDVLDDRGPPTPITDSNPLLSPTHPSHPLQDVPDCTSFYTILGVEPTAAREEIVAGAAHVKWRGVGGKHKP